MNILKRLKKLFDRKKKTFFPFAAPVLIGVLEIWTRS